MVKLFYIYIYNTFDIERMIENKIVYPGFMYYNINN